jgi:3-hydroxybutyryl-CoA dehydratase
MREWQMGDSESVTKTITEADVEEFAHISGDNNPVHLDEEYASTTRFGKRIAHGVLVAGLISATIGTRIPGHGAIYAGQCMKFLRPVYLGDTITATVTIREYDRDRGKMVLETVCRNQEGEEVISGEAEIRYKPEWAAGSGSAVAGPARKAA